MSHSMTDRELIEELQLRFERSRKAFSDLTVVNLKLREMNQKLEQSERLKSNFLSNIRNEINDPLNALVILSDQISVLSRQTPELSQMATLLHAEAFSLGFQLRNIFMAAELEAGTNQPSPTLVAIDSLLSETLESFQPLANSQQITLSGNIQTSPEQPASQIACDTEKLALIMANLVSNAIKFNQPGGQVTITLTPQNDGLHLQVIDTGIGILEEDIPRIFNRFSQLDSGSARSHHGHGLGLCVVKSLVELMGGQIEVSSQPQTGSSFSVWLPEMHAEPGEETFGVGSNLFLFEVEQDEP